MGKLEMALLAGLIITLTGCGSRVEDSDELIISSKVIWGGEGKGRFKYRVVVANSPDIYLLSTNNFDVGESLKFVVKQP